MYLHFIMPLILTNHSETMKKKPFNIFRTARPADAVSMSDKFTGGVPLTLAILQSFLAVYKGQPVLGYFLQLRLNFITWLIECKQTGTVPHVYIEVGGPCVDWYRSDTGEPIFRTTVHTSEYIMKAVHLAASFGVIIDNAWLGQRCERSGIGWWYDVTDRPLADVPFNLLPLNNSEYHAETN